MFPVWLGRLPLSTYAMGNRWAGLTGMALGTLVPRFVVMIAGMPLIMSCPEGTVVEPLTSRGVRGRTPFGFVRGEVTGVGICRGDTEGDVTTGFSSVLFGLCSRKLFKLSETFIGGTSRG